MRTTPKTQEQLDQERMLPAGEYDFTIDKAEDKISRSQNEMIELSLTIFTGNGERRMKDWVMDKVAHKLRHFAYAVGVGPMYEAGALVAQELVGRSGKVILKQGKAQGDFPARNEVADYVPLKDAKPTPAPTRVVPVSAPSDNDPPF